MSVEAISGYCSDEINKSSRSDKDWRSIIISSATSWAIDRDSMEKPFSSHWLADLKKIIPSVIGKYFLLIDTYQGSTPVALTRTIHPTSANHFLLRIFDIIYIFTGFIRYQSYCSLMSLSCRIRSPSFAPTSSIAIHWARLNGQFIGK